MRTQTNGQHGRTAEFSHAGEAQRSALAAVRRVERAFADYPWSDRRLYLRARKRAHVLVTALAEQVELRSADRGG